MNPDSSQNAIEQTASATNQLKDNIRLLGDLLGQTIVDQAGSDVFELEETIRSLSKAVRSGDENAKSTIQPIINELVHNLPLTGNIIKAFSTYFQLVNLSEKHERIRILTERTNQAYVNGLAMDESIAAAIEALKREGFSAEQVRSMLTGMLIQPVFTAHPTESRRRTTRQILGHLSDSLRTLRSPGTLPFRFPELKNELLDAITLLWQSDDSRTRKPTVMDEVRNTGLYFFENTLFDVVPKIYEELESALQQHYPDFAWHLPSILRFGSWIAGDRDGNPFVTNETTENAIRAHKKLTLERYSSDVRSLYQLMSPATDRVNFNSDFLKQLRAELADVPETESDIIDRFHQEPYRQKLILLYRRLIATQELNKHSWDEVAENRNRAFVSPEEFQNELESIRQSLIENKGSNLARGNLSRLIRRVSVFGFHLASLDIRQHSGKHQAAVNEIFEKYGIVSDYAGLPEEQKTKLLEAEIANSRPLTARLTFSRECNETVSLVRLIKQAHGQAGSNSIQSYVISMTESVSDILEVLLLMSDADLFGQLDVVPLFETIDDLKAAPKIMSELFANEAYRRYLELRNNRQQIMIGYSDSNKDGGFLRANWTLFTAQRELAAVCKDHGIELTLFHGRGGSIGRGGGPANRAILAQPAESVRGRIRLTEQGEVVSSRYSDPEIATRHLQQLLHAVICSSGRRPEFPKLDHWSQVMDQLSSIAYDKYRSLVEMPELVEYFQTATPIEHIDQLNLGSRPSRRTATKDISDLRAIPWVFAWTQSRTNIPSWFGVGTALHQWIEVDPNTRTDDLREMYRSWPFFKTLVNNVHVGMGRADMEIGELYSHLAPDRFRNELFAIIESEFQLASDNVLLVTGHDQILDTEPWLQHSIRVRNPYVDPINYIQIALLESYRNSNDDAEKEKMQRLILQAVKGIAAGLQNVG